MRGYCWDSLSSLYTCLLAYAEEDWLGIVMRIAQKISPNLTEVPSNITAG